MPLHLHHPELEAGPCNPALVREEAERAQRALRFAADVAWDNRESDACGRLNVAYWRLASVLVTLSAPTIVAPQDDQP